MRWLTVQGPTLITAVCFLKYGRIDGRREGFGCSRMCNLTQTHTVLVETHTVLVMWTVGWIPELLLSEDEIHICLLCPSACFGGEETFQSIQRLAGSEAIHQRWLAPSFMAPLHHHLKALNRFFKLTCSCSQMVLIWWFQSESGFSWGKAPHRQQLVVTL